MMDWVAIRVFGPDEESVITYATSIIPCVGGVITVIPANKRYRVETVEHVVKDTSAVPGRGQLTDIEVFVTEV